MVAKIVKGQNFKGAIDYITDIYGKDKQKKGARLIYHSSGIPPNADNRMIAMLMDSYARKGDHNLGEPVRHFILSYSRWDSPKLTDELMTRIWLEFLTRMGYKDTENILARHKSAKNPHMHGLTTRVDSKGNVVSDSFEEGRAARVALELTQKYGLHISSGKVDVSRDRLRGKDKAKYKIYDAICAAKEKTENWKGFEDELAKDDIKMKLHVNNVTGKILGVSFSTDGFSFSGRQIDKSMTLAKLSEKYGDFIEIVHENVREHYEEKREAYLHSLPMSEYFTALRTTKTFDDIYPNGVPKLKLPSVRTAIGDSMYDKLVEQGDLSPSKDGKSDFVPLAVLLFVILTPYQPQLSVGGGGGGQYAIEREAKAGISPHKLVAFHSYRSAHSMRCRTHRQSLSHRIVYMSYRHEFKSHHTAYQTGYHDDGCRERWYSAQRLRHLHRYRRGHRLTGERCHYFT